MQLHEAYQSASHLLKVCRVIGYGLQYQSCRLEMVRMQGQGVLWQRKEGEPGTGVWCSLEQWQNGVMKSCLLPDPALLGPELTACVTAELLEPAGSWLVQAITDAPEPCQLKAGFYLQLTIGDFICVLLDWPLEQWQEKLELWMPFRGSNPIVKASILAGFAKQRARRPQLPPVEGGLWLEGELFPEMGEGLLWWGMPFAKVVLEHREGVHYLTATEQWPEIEFHYSPLLAELATVEIGLVQLSHLSMGDEMELSVTLNSELLIYHDDKVIATGHLLRGKEELLVQVQTIT
ncbi:MAG: FliM/FliN family flagellar motor switch protein [Enterobacteriaceae bacterium]